MLGQLEQRAEQHPGFTTVPALLAITTKRRFLNTSPRNAKHHAALETRSWRAGRHSVREDNPASYHRSGLVVKGDPPRGPPRCADVGGGALSIAVVESTFGAQTMAVAGAQKGSRSQTRRSSRAGLGLRPRARWAPGLNDRKIEEEKSREARREEGQPARSPDFYSFT